MVERDEVYRIKTHRRAGTLSRVLEAVASHGAQIGEIETLQIRHDYNIREITVIAPDDESVPAITAAIEAVEGVELLAMPVDRVFERHKGGKLDVVPSLDVRTLQDMREIYTPGVARVSAAIAADPSLARTYTWKARTVAVVSDGSRVLGLGNVGPEASLPVMEGKAMFYSLFTDVNAVPIVLDTHDTAAIIETVTHISPGFGAIHLEDIASPGVYEIERALEETLPIPVFHDDQHGTAVVVLAAVRRAAALVGKDPSDLSFGQIGLGAAGSAIALLATEFPFAEIAAYDPAPQAAARLEALTDDPRVVTQTGDAEAMRSVMTSSDVLVMTTGRGNLMSPEWVRPGQIIMALSNPVPEIGRNAALEAGAALATDGSIVNNVLGYPGIVRGALDADAKRITGRMRRAAAETLADLASDEDLLPDPFDRSVHAAVAAAVAEAWDGPSRH